LRGHFGQAAVDVVVVVRRYGFEVDTDANAARAEETIVPLVDGGLDVVTVFGLIDIDGRADTVEVGFGVAPA
jgi:hypothetical protein